MHDKRGRGDLTISARIKEERVRLGLNQPSFAALGGATKSAQMGWERGSSVPNATVLAAWTQAGIDVSYILTGERQSERRADTLLDISEQLARYRRELVDPDLRYGVEGSRNALATILIADAKLLTLEQREEAAQLLQVAKDEAKLAEFRAAEAVALRQRKEQMKRRLASSLEGIDPPPSETVSYLLLQLAVDYGVPTRTLGELWEQIQDDRANWRDA